MKIIFTICFMFFILLIGNKLSLYAIDTVDVKPPMLNIQGYCGDFIVNVTELRSYFINKDSFQLDMGVMDTITTISTKTYNFTLPVLDTNKFHKNVPNHDFSFKMSVIDKFKKARATFLVRDIVEPFVFGDLKYDPDSLEIFPNNLFFGDILVDSTLIKNISFKNITDTVFQINEISFKYGKLFSFTEAVTTPFMLKTDSLVKLRIKYLPQRETFDYFDEDTLFIKTNCLVYSIPLRGKGVAPRIEAEDVDFDIVEVGTARIKSKVEFPESYDGLTIWDRGTGALRLLGYRYNPENTPFKFDCKNPDPDPKNNITIQPNSLPLAIKGLCFKPVSAGEFFGEIIFKSNAKGPDSISKFRGIGFDKGPYITSINFKEKRVASTSKGTICIRNTGDSPCSLTGFELENNNGDFKILKDEMSIFPSVENPVIIFPQSHPVGVVKEYYIPIEFNPKSEGYKEVKIYPTFLKDNISQRITLFNYIRGVGILPKIEPYGYNFANLTLVNVQNKDTGLIVIKSASQYADLFIKSIDTFKFSSPKINDFTILITLPKDTIIRRGTSYEIPITFKPEDSGNRKIVFRIISDAVSGNFDGKIWDTVSVTVTGIGYNKVLEVTPLSFNNAIHCDTTYGVLMVKNISNRTHDTVTAFMDHVKIESGDIKAFYVDNEYVYQKFVYLKPGDSLGFPVKFMPYNYDTTSFTALARVFSDVDTSITIIKGTSKKYDVQLSMNSNYEGIPGMFTLNKPPDYMGINYPVLIKSDYFNKLYIDSFYFEIKYRTYDLEFMDMIENGPAIKDWQLKFSNSEIDSRYSLLKVKGWGFSPITTSDTLFIPEFLIMLGDTGGISIDIQNGTFYRADECVDIVPGNGLIKLSYCGSNIRKLVISKSKYDIQVKSAVPAASGNNLSLYYSIGISATTKIKLYNSYGELVKVISDSYKAAGKYYDDMDINNLSTGIYFITIDSGPYSNRIKFILNK